MDGYTELATQIAELRAQLNNGVKGRLQRIETTVDKISQQMTQLQVMLGELQTQLTITNGRSKENMESIARLRERTLIVSTKNAIIFSVFMLLIGALLSMVLKRVM